MIFQEKKTEDCFTYKTEDLYGIIELKSKKQLSANILDSCVLKLIQGSSQKGTIRDEKNSNDIEFNFTPSSQWLEDLEV